MKNNVINLKPPIPRLGGKSRLRKGIIELIPDHTCYVEPFFGAGWVYFGKKKESRKKYGELIITNYNLKKSSELDYNVAA